VEGRVRLTLEKTGILQKIWCKGEDSKEEERKKRRQSKKVPEEKERKREPLRRNQPVVTRGRLKKEGRNNRGEVGGSRPKKEPGERNAKGDGSESHIEKKLIKGEGTEV